VDDEVRDSGVIRLLRKDLFQNLCTLELLRIGLVIPVRGYLQPIRIENRSLGVLWVTQVNLLERRLVRFRTLGEGNGLVILEHGFHRRDIVALALRLATELLRLLHGCPTLLFLFWRGR